MAVKIEDFFSYISTMKQQHCHIQAANICREAATMAPQAFRGSLLLRAMPTTPLPAKISLSRSGSSGRKRTSRQSSVFFRQSEQPSRRCTAAAAKTHTAVRLFPLPEQKLLSVFRLADRAPARLTAGGGPQYDPRREKRRKPSMRQLRTLPARRSYSQALDGGGLARSMRPIRTGCDANTPSMHTRVEPRQHPQARASTSLSRNNTATYVKRRDCSISSSAMAGLRANRRTEILNTTRRE